MKKILNKAFNTIAVMALLLVAVLPAKAQFTNSVIETGGLYTALAKDGSNNLYVTRAQSSSGGMFYEVVKYVNGAGAPVSIYSGLTHEAGDYPWGLVVASNGDVFVSTDFTSSAGAVIKLTNNGGSYSASTFLSGKYYAALAIDASDNLYTTEYNAGTVKYQVVKYPAGTTSGTILYGGLTAGTGYSYPTGLVVASNGSIYVTDAFGNIPSINDGGKITKLTAPTFTATTVSSGNYATALALDASGNLYSSENNGSGYKLVKYTGGAGSPSTIFTPLHTNAFIYPWGIAVFSPYKIFVNDGGDDLYGGLLIKLQSTLPNTTTINATSITTTSATLNGVVNADGFNAKVSFTYGTSSTLAGATTTDATVNGTAVSDAGDVTSSLNITGLLPATKYYFRVTANNFNGTTTGAIANFTTNSPLPAISYTSPVVLPVGMAANLAPVNSGGPVPALAYAQVTVLAGNSVAGSNNGTGAAASFNNPFGVATDAAGNIYLADHSGNLIRKITPAGVVTTLAGNGSAGSNDGTGAAATFTNPAGLAADAAGNVYVADYGNNKIRKVTPTGVVTTFAGYGSPGSGDGAATLATFNAPAGVAFDALGNLYVADAANNLIRKIGTDAIVSTFAGSGAAGSTNGTGTAASFNNPIAIAVDLAGNIYVADNSGNLIRKITPGAVVTTLAGSGLVGSANGIGTAASFKNPAGLATDVAGNVYVADAGNNMIRKISPAGVVTTLAGATGLGINNGIGTAAKFNSPHGLAITGSGLLYVGDFNNNRLRRITLTGWTIAGILPANLAFATATGVISGTPAGNSFAANYTITGFNNTGGGTAVIDLETIFPAPAISYASPKTYVTGTAIAALSPVNSGGAVPATVYSAVSTLAGSGAAGSANGTGALATFNGPMNMATDGAGNVYVADYSANVIRRITPAGAASTFAGSGLAGSSDGVGVAASFKNPFGVAVDALGNVYVGDSGNNLIRMITPAGAVTTFAGSGVAGNTNGTGTAALFSSPHGLTIDIGGNIYVADYGNNLIRMITPTGVVTTLAGSGAAGAVNGTGTGASFSGPITLCSDAIGNIYVGEYVNRKIRKITPAGVVTNFAGSGVSGNTDGTGVSATFKNPYGLTIDVQGNIYVADKDNNEVRKITPGAVVTTLAGNGTAGSTNGTGVLAKFNDPRGIAADLFGNLYVSDYAGHQVRKIALTGYWISPALPAGLFFNSVNGVISGTPTAISPATDYTVTAYNTGGSNATMLNITVKLGLPAISYTTPQNYTNGVAITTLSPVSSGGAVPATIYSSVTSLAGSGIAGSANGTGAAATFGGLMNMATDASGNVYVADFTGNTIRMVTPAGVTTTFAGSGAAGSTNGTGVAASFKAPFGIVIDASGNLYIGDSGNNLIRKITPAGVVTTFAGSGAAGSVNATGTAASFNTPRGLAIDAGGNIYVADYTNNLIRKITPAAVVTTLAGSGAAGAVNGTGVAASFNGPMGLCTDAAGNVYAAEYTNRKIRKITPAGVVTTFAGSGVSGNADGTGVAATFKNPYALTVDISGNIYVADEGNNEVRRITSGAVVTTLVGNGTAGSTNGTGVAAKLNDPRGVATDTFGNLYVADYAGHQVRKIVLTGYTVSPALPAGLVLNSATGDITGTPTTVSNAADYTVTAYNAAGAGTAIINIKVSAFSSMRLAQTDVPLEQPIVPDGPVVRQGISPNGDGKNDVLVIDNIEKYPSNKLVIMDRAGATIYQALGYDNTNKVFDGHSNKSQVMQKSGTYFYQLEYKDSKGATKYKTGYILLKF